MSRHHYTALAAYMSDGSPYTYFVHVRDIWMSGAGIHDGDIAVVDSGRDAAPGDIILALVYGIKVIRIWEPGFLIAVVGTVRTRERITQDMDFKILGVVLSIVRRIRP